MPQSEAERQRALRRRHKHERQAVVFGSLVAALAVAGVGSAAVYTGALSVPFLERGFSTPPPPEHSAELPAPPCPPEGTLPVPYTGISVNVLNGSGETGLAGRTGDDLTNRGFVVLSTGNYPAEITEPARVIFGAPGVAAAYTLAGTVDGAALVLDPRTDTSVDLVLGEGFGTLRDPGAVLLDPAAPLVGAPGCIPLEAALAEVAPPPPAEGEAPVEPPIEGDGPAEPPVEGEAPVEGEPPAEPPVEGDPPAEG